MNKAIARIARIHGIVTESNSPSQAKAAVAALRTAATTLRNNNFHTEADELDRMAANLSAGNTRDPWD